MSTDALIDAVWGEGRNGAHKRLQMAVARLRRVFESLDEGSESRLSTVRGGYVLRLRDDELDAEVFAGKVDSGRRALEARDPERSVDVVRAALGLWRGSPLADVAFEDFAQGEIRRLLELRSIALETRIDAELRLGRHADLVGELEALLIDHPTRERFAGQLMVALYRCGRHVDALEVYQRTRARLADELGLEPGPGLQTLQRQILNHQPELDRQSAALESAAALVQPALQSSADAQAVRGREMSPVWARQPRRRRGHLPALVSSFVGRDQELAEVTAFLAAGATRLLTLTGAGGSGKTRLAIRVAEICAPRYRDGAWFAGLEDLGDPELIAPAVCRALGIIGQPDIAPEQQLAARLAECELLLVLDNLEQLVNGSTLISRLLSNSPGLTVLATSREPLSLAGEQLYEVPALAAHEAVELFTTRVRAANPHASVPPAVASQICDELDCLPLAVELAAARTRVLSPTELLARVKSRLPLLIGGPRDAPGRQRTLEASIAWSVELLNDDERRLFRRVAVFAGGWTLAAAEAVCEARLDTLAGLLERSLIQRTGDRYRMLQTVRDFALQRLQESGELERIRSEHLQWMVSVFGSELSRAYSWPSPALHARLAPEFENFRGALAWALESGQSSQLALLVGKLTWAWWAYGHGHEAARWVDAALTRLDECPPWIAARVMAAASCVSAEMYGDLPQAERFAERSLEICRQLDDAEGVAWALIAAGAWAGVQRDHERAQRAFKEAANVATKHRLNEVLTLALADIAYYKSSLQGRLAEAGAECEQVLARPGAYDTCGGAMALLCKGHLAEVDDDYGDARTYHRMALESFLRWGNRIDASETARRIASVLACQGEFVRAARLFGFCTAFQEESSPSDSEAEAWGRRSSDRIIQILTDELGRRHLAELMTDGRRMTFDEAMRYSLEEPSGGSDVIELARHRTKLRRDR